MNSVLAQSQSLPSRSDVLSGGKAPQYWKRDISRESNRLVTVLQICDWIKTVVNARPSFFEKPLFGDCLAEITSREFPPSDETTTQVSPGSEELRPPAFGSRSRNRETLRTTSSESQRQRTWRQSVSATPGVSGLSQEPRPPANAFHLRSQSDDPDSAQRRSRSNKVSQLPRQGDALLLKRLAGKSADTLRQQPNLPNPLSSLRHKRAPTLPSVSIATLHDKDWRQLVAGRAAKIWLRDWPVATAPVSTSRASLPALRKTHTSEPGAAPLLEKQWATPLLGQMAAPEILSRVAKPSDMNGGAVSEIARSKRASPGNSDSIAARSQFFSQGSETARSKRASPVDSDSIASRSQFFNQLTAGAKRVSRHEEGNVSAKTFEDIFPERDRLLTPETRRASNSQAFANAAEHPRSSQDFARPTLTSSLPQLLPGAAPGAAVSRIATDTPLHGALRDEVNAQEKDLSVLAAQLKRILNEEARRHGIDV